MSWKYLLAGLAFWSAVVPTAEAADVPLTAAQVHSEIVGKDVNHDGRLHLTNNANGTVEGGDGRFGFSGTYRLEKEGLICWKFRGDTGCYQYYRRGAQLRVRRTDMRDGDIGPVTVSAFNR